MLGPPVHHRSRVEPHQLGSIPGGPRPPALVASSATRLPCGAEPWSQQDQSSLSRCRPAPPGASGAVTQLGSLENLTILGGDPTILGWELENLTAWAVTQQAAGAAPDLRLHPSNMCCSLLLEN